MASTLTIIYQSKNSCSFSCPSGIDRNPTKKKPISQKYLTLLHSAFKNFTKTYFNSTLLFAVKSLVFGTSTLKLIMSSKLLDSPEYDPSSKKKSFFKKKKPLLMSMRNILNLKNYDEFSEILSKNIQNWIFLTPEKNFIKQLYPTAMWPDTSVGVAICRNIYKLCAFGHYELAIALLGFAISEIREIYFTEGFTIRSWIPDVNSHLTAASRKYKKFTNKFAFWSNLLVVGYSRQQLVPKEINWLIIKFYNSSNGSFANVNVTTLILKGLQCTIKEFSWANEKNGLSKYGFEGHMFIKHYAITTLVTILKCYKTQYQKQIEEVKPHIIQYFQNEIGLHSVFECNSFWVEQEFSIFAAIKNNFGKIKLNKQQLWEFSAQIFLSYFANYELLSFQKGHKIPDVFQIIPTENVKQINATMNQFAIDSFNSCIKKEMKRRVFDTVELIIASFHHLPIFCARDMRRFYGVVLKSPVMFK